LRGNSMMRMQPGDILITSLSKGNRSPVQLRQPLSILV
jgi:hypothetical protein